MVSERNSKYLFYSFNGYGNGYQRHPYDNHDEEEGGGGG